MRAFRDLSVKWKLTWVIMVASMTPLLLCCAALIGYEVITFRDGLIRGLSSEAEFIGSNNLGNLRFHALGIDTRDDAEKTLSTLQANKHIVSAAIYSPDGELFANYLRLGQSDEFPDEPRKSEHVFVDNHLILFRPIVQDTDSLGTIYIKSDLEEVNARLIQYAGIVGMFLLGSFLVAFFLAAVLQRIISRPILKLAHTTKIVSKNKDYSARAEKLADDEVGVLIDGFNEMLSQIQDRDKELRMATEDLKESKGQLEDYSHNLEEKVSQRTHELKEKNERLEETLGQLQDMQNQIILQQKMASLGTLTAGIAHEIKNPLNFVNNFSELSIGLMQELREDIEKEKSRINPTTVENIDEILSDMEENITRINTHGKRADSIVRNMLLHSRGKPGETQDTDLNSLLDEYVSLAYHGMRAKDSSFNITINKDYDDSIGKVKAVPQDLSRVFLNILNNACYATHEKRVEVRDKFDPILAVSTKNLNGSVEVRIRDNGKGIPQDHLNKIFNPFFSTKPSGQGTGLGLSISYDIIVQQHKGDIRVETEEGSFTEFVISLPKAKATL
jgi:signal transduction histidine kinase